MDSRQLPVRNLFIPIRMYTGRVWGEFCDRVVYKLVDNMKVHMYTILKGRVSASECELSHTFL